MSCRKCGAYKNSWKCEYCGDGVKPPYEPVNKPSFPYDEDWIDRMIFWLIIAVVVIGGGAMMIIKVFVL